MTSPDKHPLSAGRADRDTFCWREHDDGVICLLPEGHKHPYKVTVAARQVMDATGGQFDVQGLDYGFIFSEHLALILNYILDTEPKT